MPALVEVFKALVKQTKQTNAPSAQEVLTLLGNNIASLSTPRMNVHI